jgi:rhomboid protease GluP
MASGGDIPVCYGLKVNALIRDGQWWRLLAPVLLHGSILHIGFNMYALFILGPELENLFGHRAFLALYLAAGFAGFVVSFLMTPANSLGASTAIFGLLAAQGVFVYRNKRIFGRRATTILRSILNIAVINFIIGLSPLIDNWGHLGGFLGGGLFALIASPDFRIAGDGPEYSLADQNPPGRALLATVVTVAIFIGLALLKR